MVTSLGENSKEDCVQNTDDNISELINFLVSNTRTYPKLHRLPDDTDKHSGVVRERYAYAMSAEHEETLPCYKTKTKPQKNKRVKQIQPKISDVFPVVVRADSAKK